MGPLNSTWRRMLWEITVELRRRKQTEVSEESVLVKTVLLETLMTIIIIIIIITTFDYERVFL